VVRLREGEGRARRAGDVAPVVLLVAAVATLGTVAGGAGGDVADARVVVAALAVAVRWRLAAGWAGEAEVLLGT